MKYQISKVICVFVLSAAALLGLTMCTEDVKSSEESLSVVESEALSTDFAIEAEEAINEANAEAEATKLAKEIEADLK